MQDENFSQLLSHYNLVHKTSHNIPKDIADRLWAQFEDVKVTEEILFEI